MNTIWETTKTCVGIYTIDTHNGYMPAEYMQEERNLGKDTTQKKAKRPNGPSTSHLLSSPSIIVIYLLTC